MRVLLGFAAFATTTLVSSAQAQSFSAPAFTAPSPGRWVMAPLHDGDRHGRMAVRVHRGLARSFGYAGYNDYSDFDGNRSFDPDKWNDWWHDRPDRAYPRWMTRNGDCARRWYSGDVLTC